MNASIAPQAATNQQCPVCGETEAVPILSKDGFDIVRCRHCHLIHVKPTPPASILAAHYNNPEYFQGEGGQGYKNYAAIKKALLPTFSRRLKVLAGRCPNRGELLDFGCAAGYFLEMAQAKGWTIAGVEVSQEMSRQATDLLKIPIHTSLADVAPGQFEAITLWEVVEHLAAPLDQLQQLRTRLQPGGLLMLSTPNTGHWQAVRAQGSWSAYCPPSHLLYFTADTLRQTLQQAGFEQIEIRRTAPLPPLPVWLQKLSQPLKQGLATGDARCWPAALYAWRLIRVISWAWQKMAHRGDDIFATLEALASRPT